MPAQFPRRRTVDGRIRAATRPRTPARVSRGRCWRSEANGSVAWAFATSGLHRRTTSRRTMASVLRYGVLPPSTRGAIASRRPGIQILKLMVHRTWAQARLRGCTETELGGSFHRLTLGSAIYGAPSEGETSGVLDGGNC